MQAVIIAAGKSTRTYPLTLTRPKPLLKVANKTILEHNLDNLNGIVDEAIIIVGYKKNMIGGYMGKKYKKIKITYVNQKQQLGTAHAASLAEKYIKNKFILMAGDDIYSRQDIKMCIKYSYAILTAKVKNPENFGIVIEKNGILDDFIEKPKKIISDMASTSFYVLDRKIFDFIKKIKKSERDELEMPDAVKMLSQKEEVHCIQSKQWIPIVYPWDLLKADVILRKGRNFIGNDSKINGIIKNSSIGKDCIINGCVKNSIIMDKTTIDKGSFIEDSVIGENVHFKGKIISKKNVFSYIKNKKIKVNLIGAVIGDNVKANNIVIHPGCKIWPNKIINNKIIFNDLL